MAEPVAAQKSPISVDVKAGRTYYWCSCGRSARQPFCDGAHKGTEFVPLPYKADVDKTVWFCACKATDAKPLCDGSHNGL